MDEVSEPNDEMVIHKTPQWGEKKKVSVVWFLEYGV